MESPKRYCDAGKKEGKKMKRETSKRTILLETSHEMRKEIVERNKKHEMSQVATQRKGNKTGRKGVSGGTKERGNSRYGNGDVKISGMKVNN